MAFIKDATQNTKVVITLINTSKNMKSFVILNIFGKKLCWDI